MKQLKRRSNKKGSLAWKTIAIAEFFGICLLVLMAWFFMDYLPYH
jgi:hypothetical protein